MTNLTSGTNDDTFVIVEAGAIPIFVRLLTYPHENIVLHAVWAIGNLAVGGYGPDLCANGAISSLLQVFGTLQFNDAVEYAISWTMANLCLSTPSPAVDFIRPSLPVFGNWLVSSDNLEIVIHALVSLISLSKASPVHSEAILSVETNVTKGLILCLQHLSPAIASKALMLLHNLLTTSTACTQILLEANVLSGLLSLMSHAKRAVQRDVILALTDITKGTSDHIQFVIDTGFIPLLINLTDLSRDVRTDGKNVDTQMIKVALWPLLNILRHGTDAQVMGLFDAGVVRSLCSIIMSPESDARCLCLALDGSIYGLNGHRELFVQRMEQSAAGCGAQIRALQNHADFEVRERAFLVSYEYLLDNDSDSDGEESQRVSDDDDTDDVEEENDNEHT